MKTLTCYLILGLILAVIETLIPQTMASKPDLLLLLVLTLGLKEKVILGGSASWLLGCLQDSVSGFSLGLYGLVYLLLYLILRSISGHLNSESPILLLFLVFVSSLLQSLILVFTLGFLAEHGTYWRQILTGIPGQILVNLLAALLFLQITTWLKPYRRRFLKQAGGLF
ncbi:cell shape-determining protein MreD, putative [Syntrophotalea carbinolica DSM 2380]|uniref:Cell shape-determining protein MreD, putative n=1 Tax=Syntrophotalea carbinolica (strain DSM 2380 / NBRC 103641 / GraBd1) TaxID=338963 RepID=Q3A5R0_SYNC1|nr:rod shape-determining protein MreD [Syntrophotalea carbinolica]ABA88297.1 cell shape-determining protein MreD, putative [Syntrophotalea carbinolica DSM 2380]